MDGTQNLSSIVVGIDGSNAAIRAAEWAIDEAVSREIPLRLVHVISRDTAPATLAPIDNSELELEYGEAVLRVAASAVTATGKPVKVETALLHGRASEALIAESRHADTVCVGSVGIGRFSRAVLGSTAADLAEGAQCTVAVIRAQQVRPRTQTGTWIVVPMDYSPDNDSVVERAMEEARLRQATVLALGAWQRHGGDITYDELDRRVQRWRHRYPDLRVYAVDTRADVASFLVEHNARVQLAVIGSSNADQVMQLVGPHGHPVLGMP
jgi:nucleotide-binding universal stress UspA family protein